MICDHFFLGMLHLLTDGKRSDDTENKKTPCITVEF